MISFLRSVCLLSIFFRCASATLVLLSLSTVLSYAQDGSSKGLAIPIAVSSCGNTSFSDYKSNTSPYTNTFGNSSPDIWYVFNIPNETQVSVSLCGSNFDTYVYILDMFSNVVAYNDDNGVLCTGTSSSLSQTLSSGLYYIVTEGYGGNTGNINLNVSIAGTGSAVVPGAGMANALNAGSYSSSGSFTDTRSNANSCLGNNIGQSSYDIFYKFVLNSQSSVELSHCGSGFDTYMHLLDQWGTEIAYSDDNYSSPCPGTQAYIQTTLPAGTYYVVSEGYGGNSGNITTSINISGGSSQPPSIVYTVPQGFTVGSSVNLSPVNSGGPVVSAPVATTLAGSGFAGFSNGIGTSSSFYTPLNTAVDQQGNVYVADADNHSIRKISPSGSVTTLAGSGYAGYADGTGTSAVFQHPSALVVDGSGYVFVSDQQNHRIRKISPLGVVTTLAGSGSAGSSNGNGTNSSFSSPIGLALDGSGNLYVADYGNHKIRVISPSGMVSTFAGTGAAGMSNGSALSSTFRNPMGICFDGSGNLYVADRLNHSIRKISSSGVVSTLAGSGSAGYANGVSNMATFNYPNGVVCDGSGNIFVADYLNHSIRKVTPSGTVTTLAGTGGAATVNGSGPSIAFNSPYGLSIDGSGTLYIAESSGHDIRKLSFGGYVISPTLPAGLSIDPVSGVITGIPTAVSPMTAYTVTGYGNSGSSSVTFSFEILPGGICLTPSNGENYMITYLPRESGMTTLSAVVAAACDKDKVQTTIAYFDGLGRDLQKIQVKGSPLGKDIIQPIVYDEAGRQAKKYLTYSTESNGGAYRADALQPGNGVFAFYNPGGNGASGDQIGAGMVRIPTPYSQTEFEKDPLSRVVEQGFPGDLWQPVPGSILGHTVKTGYDANISGEVRLWKMNANGNGAGHGNEFYQPGKLYKNVSKDENWTGGHSGSTEEFKDLQGHVILKRVWENESISFSTYYVYDDFGNLRYVLPPAVNDFGQSPISSFVESEAVFGDFIYGYHYDAKKRQVEKKIPGKGWEFMVYNRLDQVVMTQDANQRYSSPQEWFFTKYDGLGRTILTGVYRYPGSNGESGLVPDRSKRDFLQSYADGQTALWEVRDNSQLTGYSNQAMPAGDISAYLNIFYYDDYSFPGGGTYTLAGSSNKTKGLLTGSKVNVLGTTKMLLGITFYDEDGRVKGASSQNHLDGEDHTTNTYNFTGELLTSSRAHNKLNGVVTGIYLEYTYDHMGRKLKTYERIGNSSSARVLLSEVLYSETGQIASNRTHNGLNENLFYYNERGWITRSSSPGFEYQLKYNNGGNGWFNGNISEQSWGTPANLSMNYVYDYDRLNRLKSGLSNTGNDESGISYDPMGNIMTLKRGGSQVQSYTYAGNRLSSVSGGANRNYTYDQNGNAKTDGTNSFEYNMLGLVSKVTGPGAADYIYDASGKKLSKSSGGVITDYVSGIQYTDGTIDIIGTEQGIARRNTDSEYLYQYNLTDHLGNSRYTYNSTGSKIQSDDYYPFGKTFNSFVSGAKNSYLYNGKELQEGFEHYDYGARFYDPEIARWNVVDPSAEKMRRYSPYNYVFNNPMRFVDPDGMMPTGEYERIGDDEWKKISTKGDEIGVDFYHDWKNGVETTYVTDRQGHWNIINNGRAALEGQIRDKSVNWKTIYNEWSDNKGPEKSYFGGDHPSIKAIASDDLFANALEEFKESGLSKAKDAIDFIPIIDNYLTGSNMQVQMMGSFNVSFYKLGDKTLSLVQDSKSRTSFYLHLPWIENYERGTRKQTWDGTWYSPKETNTYQTYLFWSK